jgi:predicted 2-oxoglutarate/Fe(II)-dependent dioxygenase YbiX
MPERTEHLEDRIVTIDGLFDADECEALAALAEDVGFTDAPITTGRGFVMMPEVRNNTRVMIDDAPRAEAFWQRIARYTPTRPGLEAVGLNERFRFYRYSPGQYFHWHHDGAYHRSPNEHSALTAMLYLNDDFEGGSTDFDTLDGAPLRIVPRRGLVLLFDHYIRHQGAPVVRGTKYVLRTDVMFKDVQRA